jgi:hypothetical protein
VTDGEAVSRLQRRVLQRDRDGMMYDPAQNRSVSIEEVADDVRARRFIQVKRLETGSDCTYEVLLEILATNLPRGPTADVVRDVLGPSPVGGLSSLLTAMSGWTDLEESERNHRPARRRRIRHAQH